MRAQECVLAAAIFGGTLLLKLWAVYHYRFDSDESQHLHVAWAWTHGLVQYRDAFDNHMPLFHLLTAPVLALLGEHASVPFWMRLFMLPLYGISAWAIYRIGTITFSRRVGMWAAVVLGGYAPYFFCTTEFRTDNLWNPLWLLSVLVLLRGPMETRRSLAAGVLLGLCFAVSMKTTVMLLGLLLALGCTLFLLRAELPAISWGRVGRCAAAYALAAAAIPGCIMLYFAAMGVWPEFRYGVFEHNLMLHRSAAATYLRMLLLPMGLPIILLAGRHFLARQPKRERGFARTFVLLLAPCYFIVLVSFWRHVTRQDDLPFQPFAALLAVVGVLHFARNWRPLLLGRWLPAPACLALVLVALLGPRFASLTGARTEVALVREVLQLADPSDYVLDAKGETIFRPRPLFWVLEGITMDRLHKGLLADDLAARCLSTRTCVAVVSGHLPENDRAFLDANYIEVRPALRVAGKVLPSTSGPDGKIPFEVAIPASYELISPDEKVTGTLDGLPYEGARTLNQGWHDFRPAVAGETVAVIWAQAADRNFTPFHSHHAKVHG